MAKDKSSSDERERLLLWEATLEDIMIELYDRGCHFVFDAVEGDCGSRRLVGQGRNGARGFQGPKDRVRRMLNNLRDLNVHRNDKD